MKTVFLVLEAPLRGGAKALAVEEREGAAWIALERYLDTQGVVVDSNPNTEGQVSTLYADYSICECPVGECQTGSRERILPRAPGTWYVRIREGAAPYPVMERVVDWYQPLGEEPYLICTYSQVPVTYHGFDWLVNANMQTRAFDTLQAADDQS